MNKEAMGTFIARNRKSAGLTQRELAERLHVTDKAVSKWERGLSYPDVTLLEPLAEVFGIGVEELVACEKREEEPPVRAVLEISRENQQTERQRAGLRMVLSAVVMLCVALAVSWCLYAYGTSYVREQRQAVIYMKETEDGANYLYIEREGHLLRLKCGSGVDFDSLALTDENGNALGYRLDCRWNEKTYEGTVNACEEMGIMLSPRELFSMGGMADAVFEKQSVESLFGEQLVYYAGGNYFPDPYSEAEGRVYLCDYSFWTGRFWDAEAGVWRNEGENQILRIERCMAVTVSDIDGDGELEVIARNRWPEKPYAVYDWDGEEIIRLWRDSVPEEIRQDLRCVLVNESA